MTLATSKRTEISTHLCRFQSQQTTDHPGILTLSQLTLKCRHSYKSLHQKFEDRKLKAGCKECSRNQIDSFKQSDGILDHPSNLYLLLTLVKQQRICTRYHNQCKNERDLPRKLLKIPIHS